MEDFPSTITHKVSEAGSCEIAQDGKRLISIFQEFSSSYEQDFDFGAGTGH